MSRTRTNCATAIAAVLALGLIAPCAIAQSGSGSSGGAAAPAARPGAPSSTPGSRLVPTPPSAIPSSPAPSALQPGGPSSAPGNSGATPTPGLGQAAPQQQQVSPLSPQVPPPIASGGGSARSGTLGLSPGTSPSKSAQSTPGGGGKTLSDCMGFWDSATHMSKREWRAACQRVQHRLDNLRVENAK